MTRDQAEAIFPYSTLPKVQVNCPICKQKNVGILRTDRYGYEVPYAVCACGMEYLTEQLTREGYDLLYSGAYRRLVEAYAGKPGVRRHVGGPYRQFATMAFPLRRITSVLDAGGSTGMIGGSIAASYKGATLTVLDPAAQELPNGVVTVQGYLEDPIPGRYDLAVCIGVIDHLTNPVAALRNLRAVAPRLMIDYIDVKINRRVPKIDHPLYWTKDAAMRVMAECGWPIKYVWSINSRLEYRSTLLMCSAGD